MNLVRIEVRGLLGRFDHDLDFPDNWSFMILHGPNGIGKTTMLEIVDATLDGAFHRLSRMPFASAQLVFADGHVLTIDRGEPQADLFDTEEPSSRTRQPISISLGTPRGETFSDQWAAEDLEVSPALIRQIDRALPVERVEVDLWQDYGSHELLSTEEVVERYGNQLGVDTSTTRAEMPAPLADFIETQGAHLIETKRLRIEGVRPIRRGRSLGSQQSTVMHFSRDVTERLRQAHASNSRRSQELDRTFPRRVLEISTPPEATTERIKERYDEQTVLRQRLADIAILDAAADLPLPTRNLRDWERGVLWTYLNDTDEKLATFQSLLDRLDLLTQIVNSKFLFKDLRIDRDIGFRIEDDSGREIPVQSLSSGEQHELVLMYELLFNVASGRLVLIDEPEISLHVTWQQSFIEDIERIADLAGLRFVVATHSPQIIGKWGSQSRALRYDN
jgi:predicted ATPase